jgi:hypothetical protein
MVLPSQTDSMETAASPRLHELRFSINVGSDAQEEILPFLDLQFDELLASRAGIEFAAHTNIFRLQVC